MTAKSPKWVFPEKTHEPLNGGGTSDREKKGRPYSFQAWQLFTETCAESQTRTSCKMGSRFDSKGFLQFGAKPIFALACALLK